MTRIPGRPALSLGHFDLAAQGYVAEEYLLSGAAAAFLLAGDAARDGKWQTRAGDARPFAVRLVVVRPLDESRFSGTAVVEWLNVSAGGDAAPGWITMHREAIRAGHAWVGVSAQKVGIDGGAGLSLGLAPLKQADPARYAGLVHPGDTYAFDIFAQAGRAIRRDAAQLFGTRPLRHLIAFGASQSAFFLSTHINAVAPHDGAYDGYFLQARFSGVAPLHAPDIFADAVLPGIALRDDLPYPVLVVESETDIAGEAISQGGYALARQPDHDHLRVWEIAGSAHADLSIFAVANTDTDALAPAKRTRLWKPDRNLFGAMLDLPVNSAPQQYYMMNAALRAMTRWVAGGKPPSQGAPLLTREPADPVPHIERDKLGIAKGGIRSPWVDAPLMVHSGAPKLAHPMGRLIGQSRPLSAAEIAHLHPGGFDDYSAHFAAALDRAISDGFLLADHRTEILLLGTAGWEWSEAAGPTAR